MFEHGCPSSWQDPKWYVLFVCSNQEKKVTQHLKSRDVEHYLPCYSSVRQWKDRRVKLQIPLFPGYIFVHLPLIERNKVLTIPHVVSLVGPKGQPSQVSEEEIHWIILGVQCGTAGPHPYLTVGERVVVTEGALSGMEGVLLRRHNNTRIVVALESIARAFTVEIDAACVRPSGSAVHRPIPTSDAGALDPYVVPGSHGFSRAIAL
jgi:transcription antitermination factor NusG